MMPHLQNSSTTASRLNCIPVQGTSMWPALRKGDAAVIARGAKVFPGQVVVARIGDRFVIHRVEAIEAGTVTLRGDNCKEADPPVAVTAVVGVVSQVNRGNRLLELHQWDLGPTWQGRLRAALGRRWYQWRGERT